jgi:predicted DsbA family dithiol-disulfide isomerase
MSDHMAGVAKEVGLDFNFDKTIPANTFKAHQLIHLAAKAGRQDAMKERLFYAYYTEGQDINTVENLARLGAEIGLDATAIREALTSAAYGQEVRQDEYEAQQVGVRGVPFFVFDNKYAVSGAQPTELFQQVLDKVWSEKRPAVEVVADGAACGPEGCD